MLDPNPHVRLTAVKALAEVADLDMAKLLAEALGDEENAVRHAAQDALEKLGVDVLPTLIAAWQIAELRPGSGPAKSWIRSRPIGGIRTPCGMACQQSAGNCTTASLLLRLAAVGALATIGNQHVVEPLIAALHDEYWLVRQMAAQALGRIRDRRAVEPLKQAATTGHHQVHRAVAEALGRIGDPRGILTLVHMWIDPVCVPTAMQSLKEILLESGSAIPSEDLLLLTILDDPVQEWSAYYGASASINETTLDATTIRELAQRIGRPQPVAGS